MKDKLKIMFDIVNKKEYQPFAPNSNGIPSTHCNEAAIEIIEKLGFDSSQFLNSGGIGWTNANSIYINARLATLRKFLKSLTMEEAIKVTNNGGCVLVCAFNIKTGSGHVAIVAPQTPPYKKMECPIIQAGAKNGIFDLNEIFNVPELTPCLFVECKRKSNEE
jgi:hypothetical protein